MGSFRSRKTADITRNEEEDAVSNTLRVGALFMQAGTLIPQSLGVETEVCSPSWELITNLNGDSFDREVRNAGWSFFFLASNIRVIVWGHWTDKLVGKAIKRVLARARPAQFNCLEVTELSVRRFCGIPYVHVSAHSRHIQEDMVLHGIAERRRTSAATAWAMG
jgi:hypothetical protein